MPFEVHTGPSRTSKMLPAGMFPIISPAGTARTRFDAPGKTRPCPPTCNRVGAKPGQLLPEGSTIDGVGVSVGGNGVSVTFAATRVGTISVGAARVGTVVEGCAGIIEKLSAGLYDGCPPID